MYFYVVLFAFKRRTLTLENKEPPIEINLKNNNNKKYKNWKISIYWDVELVGRRTTAPPRFNAQFKIIITVKTLGSV